MKNKKILLLAAMLYAIRVSVGIQVQKFRDARSDFRDGVENTALRSLSANKPANSASLFLTPGLKQNSRQKPIAFLR